MQPRSIKLFELIYFVSLVLSILQFVLFDHFDPELADSGNWSIFGALVLVTLIALALWFFIVRRASNFLRWVYVIIVVLGVVLSASDARTAFAQGWWAVALELAVQLLDIVSAVLLFTAESRRWFASGGKLGPVDPNVFD
jgi:hypothetical protein